MPKTLASVERARSFLQGLPAWRGVTAQSRGGGTTANTWSGVDIECFYDEASDDLDCEGYTCTAYAQMRADPHEERNSTYVYDCGNGCEIHDFTYYLCGGTTYGDTDMTTSGQSTYTTTCPNSEPNCLLTLLPTQLEKIDSALLWVDLSRSECSSALSPLQVLKGRGDIYRGNPAIPDDPNNPQYNHHDAQTRVYPDSIIHIDHDYLESSGIDGLAGLLLHEAWHIMGFGHSGESSYPYSTFPFSEQQTCVRDPSQ